MTFETTRAEQNLDAFKETGYAWLDEIKTPGHEREAIKIKITDISDRIYTSPQGDRYRYLQGRIDGVGRRYSGCTHQATPA